MLPARLTDRKYLAKQYKDSSNLDVRINLHQRFSVNPYGWLPWVFDHINLPPRCRILELGCGTGALWSENRERIPVDWEINLSDFSRGMIVEAGRNLGDCHSFRYIVIDAQSIPFENGCFDAVIANHMLYHVPNRVTALAEIQRVLKTGGSFYASTIGDRHLVEIADLIGKFDVRLASWGRVADSFTLENGMAQLSPWFRNTSLYRYEDALAVTETKPLMDYILSGWADMPESEQAEFREFVAREMDARNGVFHVTKDSGMFVSIRREE